MSKTVTDGRALSDSRPFLPGIVAWADSTFPRIVDLCRYLFLIASRPKGSSQRSPTGECVGCLFSRLLSLSLIGDFKTTCTNAVRRILHLNFSASLEDHVGFDSIRLTTSKTLLRNRYFL